jgi:polysaccharide biosynthesis protein PelA
MKQNIVGIIVFFVFIALILPANDVLAQTSLLVLYKSSEGSTAEDNIFASYLEEYAQAQGYRVRYHDIEASLPSEAMLEGVHAIVTVYWGPVLAQARAYIDWLARQVVARRKVIVLNNFGAFSPDGDTWYGGEVVNQFYGALGLKFLGNWTNDPALIEVAAKDPAIVGHEAALTPDRLTHYFTIKSRHPANEVYLALRRADMAGSESAVVVKTPFGGLALENYVFTQVDGVQQPLLDLQRFFAACARAPFPEDEVVHFVKPGTPLLVLYKSSEGSTAENNLFASHLQAYAESEGYEVRYHDISTSFPSEETMEDVYAIVTVYFDPIMARASQYIDWLREQILTNTKVIILNNFGAFSPDGQTWYDGLVLNKFYNRLGLEFVGNWTDDPALIEVEHQDPAVIGHETPLTPDDLTHYFTITSIRPENDVFLSLSRRDLPDSESAVVVKTPYGGLALENYVFADDETGELKQVLNLQRFLEACLREPIPHDLRYANNSLLVLYKSSEGTSATDNLFAYYLETLAEAKGYTIIYHDISASFPSDELMSDIYGIVTTYTTSTMRRARAYIEWLSQQVVKQKKVLILGNFGAFSPGGDVWLEEAVLNRFYYLLGLEFIGNWTDDPALIEVAAKAPAMVEYEAALTPDRLTHYFEIKSLKPGNTVYLSLRRADRADSESQVVVKTPVGGLALENYVFADDDDGNPRLLLNLEDFFLECMRDPIPPGALPEKKVLALYKPAEHPTPDKTLIARFLARDLILLGYWPDYVAVDQGAPRNVDMRLYQGVITWFETPFMYQAEDYADWLLQQIIADRKVVILGNYGAFGGVYTADDGTEVQWWVSNTELNHFLAPFGVEFLGNWVGDPDILVPRVKDPAMVEAEIALQPEDFRHYYHWRSVYPDNEVYLQVGRRDLPNADSAFVARTPFGGFAFEGYLYKSDPETWELDFYLNRRKFLQACLEYEPTRRVEPIPLVKHDQIFAELRQEQKAKLPPDTTPEIRIPEEREVSRRILALYKKADEPDFSESMIASAVAPVLNHLGLYLDFQAIEDLQDEHGLLQMPDEAFMARYHGIFTWFTSPDMRDPRAYITWLERQVAAGKRVVIFGDLGASQYTDTYFEYRPARDFFEHAGGVKNLRTVESATRNQRITYLDENMMDFEREVNLRELPPVEVKVLSTDPDNQVLLRLEDANISATEPVMITQWGGLALGEYIIYTTDPMKRLKPRIRRIIEGDRTIKIPEVHYRDYWLLNPFKFFKQAYQIEEVPAPDVTTLNGYRIFYSHIDGDGFEGYSRIDQSNYSSYWVMEEIFKQFALPITASVITSEIEDNPSAYYNRAYDLSRNLFALDNVEPASHTYEHPFKWREGDLELELGPEDYTLRRLPIQYLEQTEGSMRFIDANLVPPDKKTEILLWSGDCHPDERALSILERYNRVNMNGGDPIFDERWNLRAGLSPLSLQYGNYRQIHTSGMNDFMYTSGWTENFDGMAELVTHFENTESPRRLSALNIYYHFYIGDRAEGLEGLEAAYRYCANRDIAPLFASEYARMVRDYYQTRLFNNRDGSWTVKDNGRVRTLRFDNALDQYPDFSRSSGIIGFGHVNQDLYVYLDEGNTHTIALSTVPPEQLYLAWGSHQVNDLRRSAEQIVFTSRGYGQAEFVLANLPAGATYQVAVTPDNGDPVTTETIQVDPAGFLTIQHPFLTYNTHYAITVTRQ